MAAETAGGVRGGAGGLGEAGCKTDDPAGAGVELFAVEGASALAIGIDNAKFNVEDFLATFGALTRR